VRILPKTRLRLTRVFISHALLFLALGQGRDSDRRLTAQKIYELEPDTDLIVLSACRSGGGVAIPEDPAFWADLVLLGEPD
jgi:CHAT domain-containing protein